MISTRNNFILLQGRLNKTVADKLDWGDRLARQRLGVRQPPAAFLPAGLAT
jgi:hypothetical protein